MPTRATVELRPVAVWPLQTSPDRRGNLLIQANGGRRPERERFDLNAVVAAGSGQDAEGRLERICDEATARYGLHDVRCSHRLGRVLVGEAAVVVAVSASHRTEAFEGCRYVIDELKKRAPIWKKETTDDGSEWLVPTP